MSEKYIPKASYNFRNNTQNNQGYQSENVSDNTSENVSDNTLENQSENAPQEQSFEPIENFDNAGLEDDLLRGIYSYGYEKPSFIQQKAIRPFLSGRDIIAQAQSGTGKTATFAIGVLQSINREIKETQAIIISPTRELANQTYIVLDQLGRYTGITNALIIGGTSIKENYQKLDSRPQIIIGTPGRIYNMICKSKLYTNNIKCLVLDEADEMLSKGFEEQIRNIFTKCPEDVQVGLFSATMSEDFFRITSQFMRNPIKILVKNDELTLEGIKQFYIHMVRDEYKFSALCDLYETFTISQTILYCNSKRTVEYLQERLQENNFSNAYIHGEMDQESRRDIMDRFRSGGIRMLISTDLLCRGIDVQQVSIVINYEVPFRIENYIHRIGRSGRYGRKGVAINFANDREIGIIKEIERYYSTVIDEMPSNISDFL